MKYLYNMIQTQCTRCNRSLRIEIISPLPNFKYKISTRNPTSKYGGKFCCSYCSVEYSTDIDKILKKYKYCNENIEKIQNWWRTVNKLNCL